MEFPKSSLHSELHSDEDIVTEVPSSALPPPAPPVNQVIDIDAPSPSVSQFETPDPAKPPVDSSFSDITYINPAFDSMHLTPEEQKRATDKNYIFNFSSFPASFSTPTEALDTYNTLGYKHQIQFKKYEIQKSKNQISMFSLCCAKRDKPKYHPRFQYAQTSVKLSECNVNVRFYFDKLKGSFIRKEPFKIVHDHPRSLEEKVTVSEDIIREVRDILMFERGIKLSDIQERLMAKFGLEIEGLEILNVIKLIKGDREVNEQALVQDCSNITEAFDSSNVVLNKGVPYVLFVQTRQMLEAYVKYNECIMVNVSKYRKNRYSFHIIHITGIDIHGYPICFGIGFLDIKCINAYEWIFKKFIERAEKYEIEMPKIIVLNLDDEISTVLQGIFPTSKQIISQYYIVSKVKELLGKHKRRPDIDCIVLIDKIEEIVMETEKEVFENKMSDFLKMVSFDSTVERNVANIFSKAEKWSLVSVNGTYTAGLHSLERADAIEGFTRSLKYENTILSITQHTRDKLEKKDCVLACNSKEAHAYMDHPVYKAIAKNFSLYATSIMMHQLIESYKYIAYTESDTSFKVTTDTGRNYNITLRVERILTETKDLMKQEIKEVKQCFFCNCPFFSTTEMICSHIFCVMNLIQIKNINNFAHLKRWRESNEEILPDSAQMQNDNKFLNFIEEIEDTKKRKRNKHKGGKVPMRKRKKNGLFYDEKKGIDGNLMERPNDIPDDEEMKSEASDADVNIDVEKLQKSMEMGFDSEILKYSEQKIEGIDYNKHDDDSSDGDSSDERERRNRRRNARGQKKNHIKGKTLKDKLESIQPKAQQQVKEKVKNAPRRKTRRDAKLEEEANEDSTMDVDDMSIENSELISKPK
ncbi:unnamed protein product [Moneuplotes crassus]|uniref:SWIM-type domain-containing protein n=1 Tax=Euplotes crassus TaxID=5936 RepID=A0AAD2D8S4_EUPCR|nr:unnamed protein product [Moneuplotes crassus]